MLPSLDDTIVALASPPFGAAAGIVRLSGPAVGALLDRVFCPAPPVDWRQPGRARAVAGRMAIDEQGRWLPGDLYYWPDRRSYTGQPAAEFHTLGSPPLLDALIEHLAAAGARLADPGEFTLRAFLAGRIDLTQAEAVLGVIEADDRRQLEVALEQLAGGMAAPLAAVRAKLLAILVELEAGFDFAEEDIAFISAAELAGSLAELKSTLAELVERLERRGDAARLPRVVLSGLPNAGKTSLFNRLSGGCGLVSHVAGTTRDYLTAEIDLGGVKCIVVDTAGVSAAGTHDLFEQDIQSAARTQAAQADIELVCVDASLCGETATFELELARPEKTLLVLTKSDAWPGRPGDGAGETVVAVSSLTGSGLDALRQKLREMVARACNGSDAVAGTALRCRQPLATALGCVGRAGKLAAAAQGGPSVDELVASELRGALDEVGKVVGAVYTEDLLDEIFSRFCVGK